jgi:hypothetical protein
VAALQIMETFMGACPATQETVQARQAVGEAAFRTWRSLPRDFDRGFTRRMLAVYKRAPHGTASNLGTREFTLLSRFLGPTITGRLLRALRAAPYEKSRTLSDDAYEKLITALGESVP